MTENNYQLIDSGNGEKLERFGRVRLIRPCGQAVWSPDRPAAWKGADARFIRDQGWQGTLPAVWTMQHGGVTFRLEPTPFGHLGIFPEHSSLWQWVLDRCPRTLLNLFAYSGGLTLAAAKRGITVCHVDASKGMVEWAGENARLNGLREAPIRWIVDDALKFIHREIRRGRRYDAIVLDPPTFGRGAQGEIFKIENDLPPLLAGCRQLLSSEARCVVLTCHTPGFSPLVLQHLLQQAGLGENEGGELVLVGERPVPAGAFARWKS